MNPLPNIDFPYTAPIPHQFAMKLYADTWTGKKSDTLSKTLTYIDLRTGQEDSLVMADLVFINYRTGEPAKKQFLRYPSLQTL